MYGFIPYGINVADTNFDLMYGDQIKDIWIVFKRDKDDSWTIQLSQPTE